MLGQRTVASHRKNKSRHCTGASYLEVQVAMVMLALGVAGLYSMVVVQTRQSNRLREMLPATEVAAINQANSPWARKLGVYADIQNAVLPSDSVEPDTSVEIVLDNQDTTSTTFFHNPMDAHGWGLFSHPAAYLGGSIFHFSLGNAGSWGQFHVDGLPQGDYEIFVTYPSFANIGSAIPHQVYDDNVLLGTVAVDQTTSTSEIEFNGQLFDSIGVYNVNSGSLRVRLLDGPDSSSHIIFDAILIRSRRPLQVVSLEPTANDGAQVVLEVK